MLVILMCAALMGAGYVPEGSETPVEGTPPVFEAAAPSTAADLPDGVQFDASLGSIPEEALPIPSDPSSSMPQFSSPLDGILPREEIPSSGTIGEGSDWGYDHRIYAGSVGSGQDWDVDATTGYVYAVIDTYHTTGDSLRIYRSTDNGTTWTAWTSGTCTNTDGSITNPRIVIAQAGGYTWVCIMGIWVESGNDILWMRRMRVDGTNAVWEQVSTSNVIFADLDADLGTSAYAYTAYVVSGTSDIWSARNALGGAGWVNNASQYVEPQMVPFPAIAAGAGGRVSIAFLDTRLTTNEEIRIKRSTDYGATWLSSEQVSNNSGAYGLEYTDFSSDHNTTQTSWIFVTFEDTSTSDNLAYYYSTNSSQTWTYGNVISPSSLHQGMGNVRARKITGAGAVTVAYHESGDHIMFTWASSTSPNSFISGVQINDAAGTGMWPPTAGWVSNYSAIAYSRYGGLGDYFDVFNNTGSEGESGAEIGGFTTLASSPNPFTGTAQISFSLAEGAPVTISVYDLEGRLVGTVCDGQSYPAGSHSVGFTAAEGMVPGVYFCRLSSAGTEVTHRMVMVR
jgi:hypothetical protein